MKKLLAMVLALTMLVACFASCGNDTATTSSADNTAKGEIIIGMSGPLTGGAAVYGVAVKNSAQMAVDEINAAGGFDGVMLKLIATDDTHDATKVAANYANLLEAGMHLSLGTVTTGPGLEFTELSLEDNVFFLTPSASGDKIPQYDNGFQMCFADGNQGTAAVTYVNENYKGQTIGIFYKSDDPYSKGIYDQFKAGLDSSITTVETVFQGEASDFSAQISQLKDCKLVFMPIYYQPAAIFMTQAKDVIAADAMYYGCDGFDGLTGQIDLSTIPQKVSMLSHFDSNATEGKAAEFIAKYTEKFGTDTLNQFGASAYDCVYAIFEAMKAAKEDGKTITVDMTPDEICEILKEQFTGDFTFSGNTGTDIKWQANGYVNKGASAVSLK